MNDKPAKIALFIWPIIAAILAFLLKANFFTSVLLFFGLPAWYLGYKKGKPQKNLCLAMLIGLPLMFLVEYLSYLSGAWTVTNTVFPRIGFMILENYFWAVSFLFVIITYYQYFLEPKVQHAPYYPHIRWIVFIFLTLIILFYILLLRDPGTLRDNFYYLGFGFLMILFPIIGAVVKWPNLYVKFLKTGVFFFYYTAIYEFVGLALGHWHFSGDRFLGWVKVLGYSMPLEVFFFGILLGSISVLSYYEFFD